MNFLVVANCTFNLNTFSLVPMDGLHSLSIARDANACITHLYLDVRPFEFNGIHRRRA